MSLEDINSLTELKNALQGSNQIQTIKAKVGQEGGRKFTIKDQDVSMHQIVDRYISLLKVVDLRVEENRAEAKIILQKLHIMREDLDFTKSLTPAQKRTLNFRRAIGSVWNGNQTDLEKKFYQAVHINLRMEEDYYHKDIPKDEKDLEKSMRKDILAVMKNIALESMLIREVKKEKKLLTPYFNEIGGRNIPGYQNAKSETAFLWEGNANSDKELFDIMKQAQEVANAIKLAGMSHGIVKSTLDPKVAEKASKRFENFALMISTLLLRRNDMSKFNTSIKVDVDIINKAEVSKKIEGRRKIQIKKPHPKSDPIHKAIGTAAEAISGSNKSANSKKPSKEDDNDEDSYRIIK